MRCHTRGGGKAARKKLSSGGEKLKKDPCSNKEGPGKNKQDYPVDNVVKPRREGIGGQVHVKKK